MNTPEVVRYGDGHFRRTIYGLGPYIADYPEQVLLACIVQGWCARYSSYVMAILCSQTHFRCTASSKDLDGEGGRRSHEHTVSLFETLDAKELWDEYGIVDDVMVRVDLASTLLKLTINTAIHIWLSPR
jgi:hypothetical protein